MEASIRKDDNRHVTLILDGRFDTSVTQQTEKDVEPLFGFTDCEIVIDCSRLDYISSSGLRLLMAINQRCSANRCEPLPSRGYKTGCTTYFRPQVLSICFSLRSLVGKDGYEIVEDFAFGIVERLAVA